MIWHRNEGIFFFIGIDVVNPPYLSLQLNKLWLLLVLRKSTEDIFNDLVPPGPVFPALIAPILMQVVRWTARAAFRTSGATLARSQRKSQARLPISSNTSDSDCGQP
jgi:hypothetical protein